MEQTDPSKARRMKIILMLVVLVPFISTALYFLYFWFHGITFAN